MICVIATIELEPGVRDNYLEEFQKLIPKVRAEEGCLDYGPYVDLDSGLDPQIPLRQNTVTIVEKWRDLEALRQHLKMPHMDEYHEAVEDYVKRVELQVLDPA